MIKVNYSALVHGFGILYPNRSYWEIDQDYCRCFKLLEDAVNNWERISYETKPYVMDVLQSMLRASNRIFKTGIPVYSASGAPIDYEGGVVEFSK